MYVGLPGCSESLVSLLGYVEQRGYGQQLGSNCKFAFMPGWPLECALQLGICGQASQRVGLEALHSSWVGPGICSIAQVGTQNELHTSVTYWLGIQFRQNCQLSTLAEWSHQAALCSGAAANRKAVHQDLSTSYYKPLPPSLFLSYLPWSNLGSSPSDPCEVRPK